METFVKICLKSDWTVFFKEEDFERLQNAMKSGEVIKLVNLFGSREAINGSEMAAVFVSTPESRAKFEEFEKMINAEGEEEEEKKPWE